MRNVKARGKFRFVFFGESVPAARRPKQREGAIIIDRRDWLSEPTRCVTASACCTPPQYPTNIGAARVIGGRQFVTIVVDRYRNVIPQSRLKRGPS
jgi:hypothetical protein